MEVLYNLEEKLYKELEDVSRDKKLSAGSLDMAHKLTDTIKNIRKIMMLSEGGSSQDGYSRDGYSRDGSWRAEGEYGNSHDGGYSGRHYVRGHYSREQNSMNGHSQGGYSQHGDQIKRELHRLYEKAEGKEREMLGRCLDQMDR